MTHDITKYNLVEIIKKDARNSVALLCRTLLKNVPNSYTYIYIIYNNYNN